MDARSLLNLQTASDRVGKFTHFRLFLSEFVFQVEHKEGTSQLADIFSRFEQLAAVEKNEEKEENKLNEQVANRQKTTNFVQDSEETLFFQSNALDNNLCIQNFSSLKTL